MPTCAKPKRSRPRSSPPTPATPTSQYDLAEVDGEIAEAFGAKGDDAGALAAIGEGQKACQALVAKAPGDARFVAALGAMFVSLGDLDAKAKRSDDAIGAFRQAIAVFAKRLADAPKDTLAIDGGAVAQDHLRLALDASGDAKGALAAAQASYQARKAIVALEPTAAAALNKLSVAAAEVAIVLQETNDFSGAIDLYRQGVAAAKAEGALANPPQGWSQDVATADQLLGVAFEMANDASDALAAYRDGAAALAAMPAGDPPDAAWRILLASLNSRIGAVLKTNNDLAGALAADRSAETLLTAAAAMGAPAVEGSLADAKETIALILLMQGEAADATAEWAQALPLRKALAQQSPSDANLRDLAADERSVCSGTPSGGLAVCQDAANDFALGGLARSRRRRRSVRLAGRPRRPRRRAGSGRRQRRRRGDLARKPDAGDRLGRQGAERGAVAVRRGDRGGDTGPLATRRQGL